MAVTDQAKRQTLGDVYQHAYVLYREEPGTTSPRQDQKTEEAACAAS
jgi:hypothetical protein